MDMDAIRLTAIVPVGPDDRIDPPLVDVLERLPLACELLAVAPSQAAAASMRMALAPRWTVISAPVGRAHQQNAGAAHANGRWLWFVHADSRIGERTWHALDRFMRRNSRSLGYFDLRFLGDGPRLMAINSFGVFWRARVLRMPFGDQALLMPRALFEEMGGFDVSIERGEDHDLVWRTRRAGVPVRPVGQSLHTSARRYAEHGWWRTTVEHQRETWRQARVFSRATGVRP